MAPWALWADLASRVASPYDLNPLNINPLKEVLEELVDFEKVRACEHMQLFVSATNVETGRIRVFHNAGADSGSCHGVSVSAAGVSGGDD